MADENQTQTSTQTAGETANDIGNIMGAMSSGAKPESKPSDKAGDAEQGVSNDDGGKGSEVKNPAWMSQIGDITKDADKASKLSKFEKLSDLACAYLEAEGKLGNTLVKPGENSTDEEREAFWKALGKPESADKYSIEGDEAKMFRDMAYENNLTDDQAKSIYESLKKVGENAMAQQKLAFEQQAKETQSALIAEYGKDYSKKVEMLKRGVANYGGQAVGAALAEAGLLANKDIVKMFIRLGEESSEGSAQGKTSGRADGYRSIQNGGHLSFGTDFKDK